MADVTELSASIAPNGIVERAVERLQASLRTDPAWLAKAAAFHRLHGTAKGQRELRRAMRLPFNVRTQKLSFQWEFVDAVMAEAHKEAAKLRLNLPVQPRVADYVAYQRTINPDQAEPAVQACASISLAMTAWRRCGAPVWLIENTLAELLAETEPPMGVVTPAEMKNNLQLPFRSLCLLLPVGVLSLASSDGTEFTVEALVLSDAAVLTQDARRSVKVAMAGGVEATNEWFRQPASELWVRSIHVAAFTQAQTRRNIMGPSMATYISPGAGVLGGEDHLAVRAFVCNFLLALKGRYLRRTEREPTHSCRRQKELPPHAQKQTKPYTVVGLTTPVQGSPQAPKHRGSRNVRSHWVRGHWHAYWGQDAGERLILDSRERDDGVVVFKYLRWLKPYLKGTGEAASPRYKSKE